MNSEKTTRTYLLANPNLEGEIHLKGVRLVTSQNLNKFKICIHAIIPPFLCTKRVLKFSLSFLDQVLPCHVYDNKRIFFTKLGFGINQIRVYLQKFQTQKSEKETKKRKKRKRRRGLWKTIWPAARRGPWPNYLNSQTGNPPPSHLADVRALAISTDTFFFLWTKIMRKITARIKSFPSSILLTPCLIRRPLAPTNSPPSPLHFPPASSLDYAARPP
jgi:hypothetical protein